jgi:Thiamine pyrophosphate enzyme, central domain
MQTRRSTAGHPTLPVVETVGELVREHAPRLAAPFDAIPIPPSLDFALFGARPVTTEWIQYARLETPGERIAILAGPDVLPFVNGLHEFAHHVNAPVANTWGAKGIYPWDNPHHMGTCGLQARDFELLGLADFDLLVVTGIDEHESEHDRYAVTEVVDVDPKFLLSLLDYVPERSFAIEPNALYEQLASVVQPGYVDERMPRHPARAVIDLKQRLGDDTMVFAQPGPAGLWVARAFPTERAASVFVPSVAAEGIAAALAFCAAAQGHRVVLVIDHSDATTDAFVRLGVERALPLEVEDWSESVDFSPTQDLVRIAGPVVAWTA